jgi:Xaa-Pro aminopeptidase
MTERFAEARARLGKHLGEGGVAIIPAATEVTRSNDVTFDFHQDPDFLYLTGFNEPDAIAVIAPGHDDGDYALFVRPRDPEKEAWDGVRAGVDGAKERHGADAAFDVAEFDTVIRRYAGGRDTLWYSMGNPRLDEKILQLLRNGRTLRSRAGQTVPEALRDLSVVLGEMRLVKTAEEQEIMARVCELSAAGHAEAMRFAAPGRTEFEVQQVMEHVWRMAGARHNGYPSIVASGANTCILHYVDNDATLGESDLVLIDAAAEIDGYSSDITRTFPANGVFTGPQRAIYEIVLEAEKQGVASAVAGADFRRLTEDASRTLTEGLVELGLLPLSVEESLAMHHYRQFFFHGLGHWLGLDVHDVGAGRIEGKPRELVPGMTFTIEPGLYIAADKAEIELSLLEYDIDAWNLRRVIEGPSAAAKEAEEIEAAEKVKHEIPKEFLGIGVRIEDDVLVTTDGNVNLSRSVPFEIDDIEAMCAEPSRLRA